MAIEVVTESSTTHPKEVLEANAIDLIIKALEDYFPEAPERGLVINILHTLQKHKGRM